MMFGGGFGWIGLVIWLVIVIAAIVGIAWFAVTMVQRADERNQQRKTLDQSGLTPREIAATRYAKGEISREDYQQLISDLSS